MPSCLRLFWHWLRAAASRTFCTAGTSRPIRMAMMAITTSSSMSVKPWRDVERRSMGLLPNKRKNEDGARLLLVCWTAYEALRSLQTSSGRSAAAEVRTSDGEGRAEKQFALFALIRGPIANLDGQAAIDWASAAK